MRRVGGFFCLLQEKVSRCGTKYRNAPSKNISLNFATTGLEQRREEKLN